MDKNKEDMSQLFSLKSQSVIKSDIVTPRFSALYLNVFYHFRKAASFPGCFGDFMSILVKILLYVAQICNGSAYNFNKINLPLDQ